jgi:hypothetical protein
MPRVSSEARDDIQVDEQLLRETSKEELTPAHRSLITDYSDFILDRHQLVQ